MSLYFARMNPEHIERAFEIEAAGYPADEAATLDGLRFRAFNTATEARNLMYCIFMVGCKEANLFFVGAYLSSNTAASDLIGFVCGTCCKGYVCFQAHDGLLTPFA
jgi:hypothetical protein